MSPADACSSWVISIALADEENSVAARAGLLRAQPALSTQIKEPEGRLEATLIERTPERGALLASAGASPRPRRARCYGWWTTWAPPSMATAWS